MALYKNGRRIEPRSNFNNARAGTLVSPKMDEFPMEATTGCKGKGVWAILEKLANNANTPETINCVAEIALKALDIQEQQETKRVESAHISDEKIETNRIWHSAQLEHHRISRDINANNNSYWLNSQQLNNTRLAIEHEQNVKNNMITHHTEE